MNLLGLVWGDSINCEASTFLGAGSGTLSVLLSILKSVVVGNSDDFESFIEPSLANPRGSDCPSQYFDGGKVLGSMEPIPDVMAAPKITDESEYLNFICNSV